MTLTYLSKYNSVKLDNSGSGVVVLKPETGQYWLPTTVHIGTVIVTGAVANVGLFVGAPGVYDSTTRLDFTNQGNNDNSGMVSSHVVFPGQTISAQFFGGVPGDTAVMTVTGTSSDIPPTIGTEPGIPGTRFGGAPLGVTIFGTPNVNVVNTPNVSVTNTPSVTISGTPSVNAAITGQPISVTEANISMYANQGPFAINVSINAGATAVILAATVGRTYRLHELRVEPVATATLDLNIQDTSGANLAILLLEVVGAPTNTFRPSYGPINFHGAPVGAGLGVQLMNPTAATQQYVGYLTYSF